MSAKTLLKKFWKMVDIPKYKWLNLAFAGLGFPTPNLFIFPKKMPLSRYVRHWGTKDHLMRFPRKPEKAAWRDHLEAKNRPWSSVVTLWGNSPELQG